LWSTIKHGRCSTKSQTESLKAQLLERSNENLLSIIRFCKKNVIKKGLISVSFMLGKGPGTWKYGLVSWQMRKITAILRTRVLALALQWDVVIVIYWAQLVVIWLFVVRLILRTLQHLDLYLYSRIGQLLSKQTWTLRFTETISNKYQTKMKMFRDRIA
jgi:hypothetical protein